MAQESAGFLLWIDDQDRKFLALRLPGGREQTVQAAESVCFLAKSEFQPRFLRGGQVSPPLHPWPRIVARQFVRELVPLIKQLESAGWAEFSADHCYKSKMDRP